MRTCVVLRDAVKFLTFPGAGGAGLLSKRPSRAKTVLLDQCPYARALKYSSRALSSSG